MVTAGANQAFTNVVLALLDAADRAVLFAPYYFNHLMALQMSGGGAGVVLGPREEASGHPDLAWLERQLAGPRPPKMVVVTNPCNPSGEPSGASGKLAAWKGGRRACCEPAAFNRARLPRL
jgi:aspartate/methionine/tyrosine aminotransferase